MSSKSRLKALDNYVSNMDLQSQDITGRTRTNQTFRKDFRQSFSQYANSATRAQTELGGKFRGKKVEGSFREEIAARQVFNETELAAQ